MIYASAAAVVIALLAWDVARRFINSRGDLEVFQSWASEHEVSVNERFRRAASAAILADAKQKIADTEKRIDALESLKKSVEALELRRQEHSVNLSNRIAALEVVASAPVDLTKHDAAVRNLGVQLKELSDHVEEQFKRERASRAGMLAGPQARRIVG